MVQRLFPAVLIFATLSLALGARSPALASEQPATAANDYAQDASWLCRPGRQDACAIDHTTTVVAADGSLTRETWTADPSASIDCFYVYPTISTDPGVNSDMQPDPAERNVVAQQFARFASACRPFAPLYRQVTLAGLRQRMAGGEFGLGRGLAYDDVRDAWRHYLANDNGGRGVVLVGHSQGAFILTELLRQEIEGRPIQKQLVSALLIGTTVTVAKGQDTGGSFTTLPVCRSDTQIGCVVSFATYRSTIPPPANALFGRAPAPGEIAVCTNPANFGEGPAPLHAYLAAGGRTITGTQAPPVWAAGRTIDTPWVSVPGLVSARCAANEHATFLEITVHADPADPRADDIPGDLGPPGNPAANWGLHLVDMNLAMGNLVALVKRQGRAYDSRQ